MEGPAPEDPSGTLDALAGPGPPPGWRLLAASATGAAHLRRGAGNEDAWRAASVRAAPGAGTLLLALADGAGSAPRAAEGAALACEAALAALPAEGGGAAALRGALAAAAAALAVRARASGEPVRAFACTLLLARLGPERLELLQLGDGVGALRRAGAWERPVPACRGEHAGETVFVSSADPQTAAALRSLPLAGVDALALVSDGLEPLATDLASGAPHAPFFEPLVRFARGDAPADDARRAAELARFLASERVAARSDDDRTLLLAVRGP